MFRSLRTRMLTAYVLMAMLLVFCVAFTISSISLSRSALEEKEIIQEVAREAREVARSELRGKKRFSEVAQAIARELQRSGVRIVLWEMRGEQLVPIAFGIPPTPPQFPLRLNALFHIRAKHIAVPGGQIVIYPDMRSAENMLDAMLLTMIPIGLLVSFIAFLFARYITDRTLRPLEETTQALRRFASGDFTPHPIAVQGRSEREIDELVSAYNGAAKQVASAFAERMKAELEMRQFIADAGHELRTPLTVIMGFLDVLRRRTAGDPTVTARVHETMLFESRRMKILIEKLITLARLENPLESEAEDVDLAKLTARVISSLSVLRETTRISLKAEPNVVVYAKEGDLYEAVANIIDNALKYAPDSPITVSVSSQAGRAFCEVSDQGPGISPQDQAHIFDRFYRGKYRGKGEGYGLGLAIAKRGVERSGGDISVESAPGEGARFRISLPLALVE